jgi:hypothetical protein
MNFCAKIPSLIPLSTCAGQPGRLSSFFGSSEQCSAFKTKSSPPQSDWRRGDHRRRGGRAGPYLTANAFHEASSGIAGKLNATGNDGTVTRFGWKTQNKSLVIAGEAYNVEPGLSNEVFPNGRSAVPGCVFNSAPEDAGDPGPLQPR